MIDNMVLAHINLEAILSNLEILAAEDATAAKAARSFDGAITFAVGIGGPSTTLNFHGGNISVQSGGAAQSGIKLFFPHPVLLNNMFSGSGIGFPLLAGNLTQIKGLLAFVKLAKRMEEVLKGDGAPDELKAKLMLNTIAKTMAAIATNEPEGKAAAASLNGTAQLSIRDGYAVHVDFNGSRATGHIGKAVDPDLLMEFKDNRFFLDLADDKVDTMAALCLQDLVLDGDLHMGDIVNVFLDKVGQYLA